MASYSHPPPTYTAEDPELNASQSIDRDAPLNDDADGLQILLIPSADTAHFQQGYLGAEGEQAAIEGELQVKGAVQSQWSRVAITLRTVENAYGDEIELTKSEVVLFSASPSNPEPLPSSFPFAIPLTQDTPQCVHTPRSSLSHILTASLYPSDPTKSTVTKSTTVHTTRYTSHAYTVPTVPETHSLSEPTPVDVQIPRSTFKFGEPVPIYVTVPPPPRELVLDQGIRIRNVRAEFVRVVGIKRRDDRGEFQTTASASAPPPASSSTANEKSSLHYALPNEGPSNAATSTTVEGRPSQPSSSHPHSPSSSPQSFYTTVLARSGASCRFHSSRPIRLRFVLHQPVPTASPSNLTAQLPRPDHYRNHHLDTSPDGGCASITQETLLHSVSFRINIHVSFVDMSTRTERFHTVVIPITLIPPSASLPELDESMNAAYQKKHDRPPTKTVRQDDQEHSAPNYEEEGSHSRAGPSEHASSAQQQQQQQQHAGAPPPFSEREAPPPFEGEGSSAHPAARLPSFLESETEIYVPPPTSESDPLHQNQSQVDEAGSYRVGGTALDITGEGTLFGFGPDAQFDGHSDAMPLRPSPGSGASGGGGGVSGGMGIEDREPPPSVEMARHDTDVTGLTNLGESAVEALSRAIALEQGDGGVIQPANIGIGVDVGDDGGVAPPPPPPAMDDPSDPPPSIDSEFRMPGPTGSSPLLPPLSRTNSNQHHNQHQHQHYSQEAAAPNQPRGSPPLLAPVPQRPGTLGVGVGVRVGATQGHAPPPYLGDGIGEHEDEDEEGRVARPPPYVDFMPR